MFYFFFSHLFRNFDFVELTFHSEKEKNMFYFFFSHLFRNFAVLKP